MGSRVNYVVVRDGEHTVYAQGGGAGYGIDYLFAPGPEVVLRWLAQAGEYAGDHWFDDLMCEGGVLIDVDRQVLLLFNTTFNRLAHRAAMLQAYAATWSGWEIRWAYDGIGDLMAYVGLDPGPRVSTINRSSVSATSSCRATPSGPSSPSAAPTGWCASTG
ncbi:hypothetical protein ACFQZ4_08585 [Catellatospora coxensis]